MSTEKPQEAVHITESYNFGNNFFNPDSKFFEYLGGPKRMHSDSERFSDGSWTIVTSPGNAQNVIHHSFRLFEETRTIFDDVSEYVLEMSTKIVTTPEGQMLLEFLTSYEKKLFKYFNDGEAIVRLEWAKGWGFSNKGPNTNAEVLARVKKLGKFGPLKYFVNILNKHDPFRVFTIKFTDFILE
ncbi:unnamed protein product [Allacma fusca]|uniref:Cholesterol oxidase substrate-binding domain-containing protein n=1 Tax=Allacma fusca TaxID=39272 RepID=A0A8J2KHX7_9HEXA|nr:unnamed protein product [Allacma fusca]